jgi:hypothetical protein
MKKSAVFYWLLAAAVFCVSCSAAKRITEQPVMVDQYIINDFSGQDDSEKSLANDTAIAAAFTLDYRPQKAEGDDGAETLSAADLAGAQGGNSGAGTVVGGGLRKLADYKTVYFDPVKEKIRIDEIRAAQEKAGEEKLQNVNAGPLTVIDWGPRGNYSSAIQRPSVYVIFSQPMVSLAALGEQSARSPVVSINPPIRGSFRW